ncbi:MAG: hypothetical protein H7Y42_02345 [Chitinophagaceae bacterium]|nr:hypothetical protein [Chitinophagaceae bacterium]
MKHIILLLVAGALTVGANAQSEKYTKAMEGLVVAVDTTHSMNGLTELANSFERIANAEKTQWLPYYYAALCHISKANMHFQTQQLDQIDPLMDKAEPLLAKAEELEKNNSEIYCVKKMFNTAKMMGDPMNRYMTYGPAAAEALATAKKLNPENPRVYLLEGIDKYFTPEQFGGSKEEGKKLFQDAAKKFETFKPASTIHPSWGMGQVKYFLAQP